MIETFYNTFGFIGALSIAMASFILLIFWISGVAGIADKKDDKYKNLKLVLCILIPVYPIFWMWMDMYRQHSNMHQH